MFILSLTLNRILLSCVEYGDTSLLPLLPGPLWSEVVVPISFIFMGKIELFANY